MTGLLVIVGALAAFMIVYRHARYRQAAQFVKHFAGRLSALGDTIEFEYRGGLFQLCRIASGGGLGGTGSHAQLVLFLADGTPLVITPPGAAKYVYAFSVPREHSCLGEAGAGLLIVGPEHRKAASALAPVMTSCLVSRLFSRPFSTLKIQSEIRLAWGRPLSRTWTLRLAGVPEHTYNEPAALQPILDDVIEVAGTLGLKLTERLPEAA